MAQESIFCVLKIWKFGHFSSFFQISIRSTAKYRLKLIEYLELFIRQLFVKKNFGANQCVIVFKNYLLCNFGEKWPISAKNGQNLAKWARKNRRFLKTQWATNQMLGCGWSLGRSHFTPEVSGLNSQVAPCPFGTIRTLRISLAIRPMPHSMDAENSARIPYSTITIGTVTCNMYMYNVTCIIFKYNYNYNYI